MEKMALGNFREFEAKCLQPGSPLKKKKIRAKEGENLTLKMLRKLVACYIGRTFYKEALIVRMRGST